MADSKTEWLEQWEERGRAVRAVFGETDPPGKVTSFSWKDFVLPGACAMTFPPRPGRMHYTHMTLGLSQQRADTPTYRWEYAVNTITANDWASDLLYQLVTQWLCERGKMGYGYSLPLLFFHDPAKKLWAGVIEESTEIEAVGNIRGMFLWIDRHKTTFRTSLGDFGILSVICVTRDEEELAAICSPAHLVLLLRRLIPEDVCDPWRQSVTSNSRFQSEWANIQRLSDDDVFAALATT